MPVTASAAAVTAATIISATGTAANAGCSVLNTYRSEQERSSGTNKSNTSKDGNENFEVVDKRGPPEIKDFESLQTPFTKVLEILKKDKVKVICIHGIVGVGKTTVMEKVNDDKKVAKIFDVVIWLNCSTEMGGRNKSREQLQQEIARRLNLNIEGVENVEEVSLKINKKLEGVNYLLLLDDVKQNLKLDEIGIPHGGKTGRKIVLTSRSRLYGPWFSVGSSDTDRMIQMNLMSIKEDWKMFKHVLNSPELIRNREKEALARALCNECLRLPLLIAIQAKTFRVYHDLFRDDNWRVWTQKNRQGIYEIFDRLKKCYDCLDDPKKKCFLYCALYPVECEIDSKNLWKSWVAEDFLSDHGDAQAQENSVGNGEDLKSLKAQKILIDLKEASWLGKRKENVIMQRIMREAALDFCSDGKSDFMLVVSTDKVSEKDWEKWSGKKYISLTFGVDRLSGTPKCSNLSTLFLQKNQNLTEVPDSFFQGMEELRVLDLSGSGITSIQKFELNKIKVLCLRDCQGLSMLPWEVEQLEKLEALDIRGTKLSEEVMNNLKALKCLRT